MLGNVVLDRDDAGWGPNSTFKYPRHGGTGGLFDRMRPYVQDNLRLSTGVASVDIERKQVVLNGLVIANQSGWSRHRRLRDPVRR